MLKRMILPLLFGVIGCAILISLGVWQLQRLQWKEETLAVIDERLTSEPAALPNDPLESAHEYLPVRVDGSLGNQFIRVLASQKRIGAGYRIISPLSVEGRVVMVDRGFVAIDEQPQSGVFEPVEIVGNLHWPDEVDGFTPEPDLTENIWFARDVDRMAEYLGTEPVLIVMSKSSFYDTPVIPRPVSSVGIPNDHLQYAITWFSLAALWFGMTVYLLWRIRQRTI